MKKSVLKTAVCSVSIAMLLAMPMSSITANAEDAKFAINCPSEAMVGTDIATSVTCNSIDEFASLCFTLTYDPTYLKPRKNNENELLWNVNTDAGNPKNDSAEITEGENGILYLMIPEEVTYHELTLDLRFDVIAEGTADFTLDITEINRDPDTEITHGENPVATASITIKSQNIETTTTTETTTTETTTTTSTEAATTTSLTSSNETTTTTSNNSASETTTTTSAITASTDSNTTSSSTTQPTTPSTSNTESSSQSTTSTSSTTKTTTTTKSTTTTKTTTTTSNNKNNDGSVDTGDDFPVALLLASVGVAGVALVTTSPRKKDEE